VSVVDGKRLGSQIFEQIRLAFEFLTILPVAPVDASSDRTVVASFRWFPLVGFAIGALLCLEDAALSFFLAPALRSALVVMSLAALTGAVHLDGLADTADALGAGRHRTRALEILRDVHTGAFGTLALVFVVVLKIFALAGAQGASRYAALWLAPGLARWSMVAVAWKMDYLREQGAGTGLLDRDDSRGLIGASAIAALAVIPVAGFHAMLSCAVAFAITVALRAFYRRWLGGITGDLIGAAGEIVELWVLVLMAAHASAAIRI
jgi:adenosylcobinamide-GDP ribazoletransferase